VTRFDCDTDERLSPDKEQELYRIAQEALNNVVKHAHAGRVDVRLAIAAGEAELEISDNGVGFERSLSGGYGLGLRGMHERVERLGGTLRIDTSPGAGTRLRVDVPR
jgi:signal transduction histidine kinase